MTNHRPTSTQPTSASASPGKYQGDNVYRSGNGKEFYLPESEYKARVGTPNHQQSGGRLGHIPNAGFPKGVYGREG